jgi:sugar/nucleoside kinase (ribokinase family)
VTVVVLGDVMADVVATVPRELARGSDTPARVRFAGGGQGANVAAWLAWLGVDAVLVARVGDDVAGRAAREELAARGVRLCVEVDAERSTGACVVLVEPGGERTMLPDPGANDAPVALPAGLLGRGGHLHVAGYTLLRAGSRPGALAALAAAAEAGATTSLDASSHALLDPRSFAGVRVDLVKANTEELHALTRGDEPAALLPLAREAVVTRADGAQWTDGTMSAEAFAEVVEVVDTTGAGDAFVAGLLAARARGERPDAALAAGCRAAAVAVGREGGRPPAPGEPAPSTID